MFDPNTHDIALRTARLSQMHLISQLKEIGVELPATVDAVMVCNMAGRALLDIELDLVRHGRMGVCTRQGVVA